MNALDQDLNVDNLQKITRDNASNFETPYVAQAKKDFGKRANILYKDKSGVVRKITEEELINSSDVLLTPEQKGFILISWQQATFNGWFTVSAQNNDLANNKSAAPIDSTPLFIDASSLDNKVCIYNTVTFATNVSEEDPESQKTFYASGTLSVDITHLKGETFSLGRASAEPTIKFQIAGGVNIVPKDLQQQNAEAQSLKEPILTDNINLYLRLKSEGINDNTSIRDKLIV